MRDTQLDMYRGLAMIYIVCFIHVISWFHIGEEPFVSMVLFEMPVMFFIAGAAQSLSKKKKNFGHIVWSRFKRVVLPFYIYAIVSLIILLVLTIVYKNLYPQILTIFGEKVANKYTFNLFTYTWSDIRQIVLCQDIPQSPLMWHVWFVVPYFLLSCLFYGQQRLSYRIGWGGGYFLICIALCVIIWVFKIEGLIRLLVAYNVFYMAGYLFYKQLKMKYVAIAGLVLLFILSFFWLNNGFSVTPMQYHKEHCDYIFMTFGLFALTGLALLFYKIKIVPNRLLNIWNERGYTIYLYQNFVYFSFFPIYLKWIAKWNSVLLQIVVCGLCIFTLSSLLSYLTYKLERLVLGKI